jgi:hypothetical protein
LGFNASDLVGTYFAQANYVISGVVAEPPACIITVTPSKSNAPPGTAVFTTGAAEPFVITGI